MGSSTSQTPCFRIEASVLYYGPGSGWLAFGTLVSVTPWGSLMTGKLS
jgi:hypothetical protein